MQGGSDPGGSVDNLLPTMRICQGLTGGLEPECTKQTTPGSAGDYHIKLTLAAAMPISTIVFMHDEQENTNNFGNIKRAYGL